MPQSTCPGERSNETQKQFIDFLSRSDYRIRLNGDWDMDIPKGYHQLSQYCATLAHKANHSFTPNVEWGIFEHPRLVSRCECYHN